MQRHPLGRGAEWSMMSRKLFAGRYWFFEDTPKLGEPSSAIWAVLPEKDLYSGTSSFQEIEVFDTEEYGRVLALDGLVQLSTNHEFIYHEMLVHPAMLYHGNPKKVLIVGGGDGGTLREVLKHPVEEVLLVEIDKQVIEVCRAYLPMVASGAFEDERVSIRFADAADVLPTFHGRFDLVINDCTDPYGPSTELWEGAFFTHVREALCEGGVASFQTGFFSETFARRSRKLLRQIFPSTILHRAYVRCFPSDECSFTIASAGVALREIPLALIRERYASLNLQTRYYSPDIHFASSLLPGYIDET